MADPSGRPAQPPDPYAVLGVPPTASDAELRAAHRRLVQLHHPDHGGTARAFEEAQAAYAQVRADRLRAAAPHAEAGDIDARLAALEDELRTQRGRREAGAARPRAAREPRDEPRPVDPAPKRASDGELGYVRTTDSFTRIIDDWLEGRG